MGYISLKRGDWVAASGYLGFSANSINAITFASPEEAWIAGEEGEGEKRKPFLAQRRLTQGKWQETRIPIKPSDLPTSLDSVVVSSPTERWALETSSIAAVDYGSLLHVEKRGAKWQTSELEMPLSSGVVTLRAMEFPAPAEGWVVGGKEHSFGHGAPVLVQLTKQKEKWAMKETALPSDLPGRLNSVSFYSKDAGWAVGYAIPDIAIGKAEPLLYRIERKAGAWSVRKVAPPEFHAEEGLNYVKFLSARHGWILSDKRLFETLDGGATWKSAARHDFAALRKISALPTGETLLAGDQLFVGKVQSEKP